jgi:hypothetical protein
VRPLTRHEKARIFHWIRAVEELVRSGPLVRGDECLAKAIIDYPSVAAVGWTWPGELRLAAALNESDRNIRKRERRLRALGMLVVVAPSEGWRSNRYVPILANRPLFESALGSAKVRAAISAQCGEDHGPTIAAPESVESGTLVPPREEPPFHSERNERSADSRGETLQENISPTLYSSLSPFQWKEEAFDFPQMDQAVPSINGKPTMSSTDCGSDNSTTCLARALLLLGRGLPCIHQRKANHELDRLRI